MELVAPPNFAHFCQYHLVPSHPLFLASSPLPLPSVGTSSYCSVTLWCPFGCLPFSESQTWRFLCLEKVSVGCRTRAFTGEQEDMGSSGAFSKSGGVDFSLKFLLSLLSAHPGFQVCGRRNLVPACPPHSPTLLVSQGLRH